MQAWVCVGLSIQVIVKCLELINYGDWIYGSWHPIHKFIWTLHFYNEKKKKKKAVESLQFKKSIIQ